MCSISEVVYTCIGLRSQCDMFMSQIQASLDFFNKRSRIEEF